MKPQLALPNGQLRPAKADDLGVLMAILHDRQVRRFLCDDTALPRETIAELLARSDQLDARGLGLWMIAYSDEGVVGVAGLEPVSEELEDVPSMAGGIEPLIAVNPVHWGQGLASQAMNTLIRYAHDTLGLSELVAAVDEPNTLSHRLMERCGFKPIGSTPGPANALVLYRMQFSTSETQD